MRLLSAFFAVLLLLPSCHFFKGNENSHQEVYSKNRQKMETEALKRLQVARMQLANAEYAQAKETVENMRKDCYLAIDARKKGLLLMDSIDWNLAKQELSKVDSLMCAGSKDVSQDDFEEACRKVQFYERKIQYDQKRLLEEQQKK